MSTWRLACIALVDFAIKACGKEVNLNQSLVVVDQTGRNILALNQIAAGYGIRTGDPLNIGWTRCPALKVLDWSTERIEVETQTVLKALEALSPSCQVVPGYIGYFMIDARGMSLLGGEGGLSRRIRERCISIGYDDVRVGLASQWGIAFLAARTADEKQPVCSILDADHRAFINQISLQDITCTPTVEQGLKLLGVEELGQLNALPRSALRERFGDALESVFTLIDVLDFRTPHMNHDPEQPKVEWSLEQPVWMAGHLLLGLRHLCISLSTQLMVIAHQTTGLLLKLLLDDGVEMIENLQVSAPVSKAETLFDLVRVRIESDRIKALSSPITQIQIEACGLTPLEGEQICFGAGRWQEHKAQAVINRLRAHSNQPVVYQALATTSSLHDEAYQWAPISRLGDAAVPKPECLESPKLVCRRLPVPVEIQVKHDLEHGVSAIRLNGYWRSAIVVSRERRSGGWWERIPYTFEDVCVDVSRYGMCWLRHLTAEHKWLLMGGWD